MSGTKDTFTPGMALTIANEESHDERLSRAILVMTATQSRRTLPIILGAAVVIGAALWNEQPNDRLVAWLLMISLSSFLTVIFFTDSTETINAADKTKLKRLRSKKFINVALNTLIVGSGFWWIGLVGSEHTIIAITLISCLYQTGAMVNASFDYSSFAVGVVLNLGQGVLFFSGPAGNAPNPEIAITIAGVMFLFLSFGRVNARQFSESIKIRAENVELVKQLAKEKQTVEQALAEAQEANRAKSHFLAAASHDLRQPLHAMGLFLGSLSMMIDGEEARKLLRRIRETTDVLTGHFNSLLDISRFDAGGIEVEKSDFNIGALLNSAVDEFRLQAENKGLAISLKTGEWLVNSDEILVDRVIRNLISNAVRYTENGAVSVVAEDKGDHVAVSIIDSGPGIAEEEQKHIFDEFVQLNNPARRSEQGVGIGLAIVKRIDSLLGLSLRLRSTEGLGSRFEFSLPLGTDDLKQNAPKLVEPDRTTPPACVAEGLKVWVLEDDKAAAEALCVQLEAWHCKVTLATTRQELQAEYEETGIWPDYALFDDMLGTGESGLEIAGWLGNHVPKERIVMVTGNTATERMSEISDQGFPLILKPMSTQRLVEVLSGN